MLHSAHLNGSTLFTFVHIMLRKHTFSHTRSGLTLFLLMCEIILSHIQMQTRSSGPYVSSLPEKSAQHRYPCEISVTNKYEISLTRQITYMHFFWRMTVFLRIVETVRKIFNVEIPAIKAGLQRGILEHILLKHIYSML